MMSMKKTAACAVLICIILCAGCGVTAVTYNGLDSISEGAPRYIEGSYSEDIDISEFESLTGLLVRQSLPESYASEPISGGAQYDKNGSIINMTVGIGERGNGFPASVSVFSNELWSDLSYSPVDYRYGRDETNDLLTTTIGQTSVLFFHYDDSKEKEYKLGHDVYIAEFELNDIDVYVETKTLSQHEFEQFVTSLIETAEKGE